MSRRGVLLGAVLVTLGVISPTHSERITTEKQPGRAMRAPTIPYVLEGGAYYSEGCMGSAEGPNGPIQCMCPIWFLDDFTGTFDLSLIANDEPDKTRYEITDVAWLLDAGGELTVLTGTGFYTVIVDDGETFQRLQLFLTFDDGSTTEAFTFDSGIVPGGEGGDAPPIDVAVTMNGLAGCYDVLIQVTASRPVPGKAAD